MIESEFYCVFCGHKNISIMRPRSQMRKDGHLKKLFCHYCKKETNNVECNYVNNYTHDNFLEEFYGGNFDEDGQRKMKYTKFCSEMDFNEIYERIKNGES